MRIEQNHNRIVIILSEAESNFLAQKATATGQKEVATYIKAKLLKALELKGFEDGAIVNMANNFNLAKIKDISKELSKRQASPDKLVQDDKDQTPEDGNVIKTEEDLIAEILAEVGQPSIKPREHAKIEPEVRPTRINKEVVDDLLADLLDKDLLEGRPPESDRHSRSRFRAADKDNPKAIKPRKHENKSEKDED